MALTTTAAITATVADLTKFTRRTVHIDTSGTPITSSISESVQAASGNVASLLVAGAILLVAGALVDSLLHSYAWLRAWCQVSNHDLPKMLKQAKKHLK